MCADPRADNAPLNLSSRSSPSGGSEPLLSRDPSWLLAIAGFDPDRERGLEAAFTVGNGYIGTRGALEEGSDLSLPLAILAGVFDPIRAEPDPPNDPTEVPSPISAPNWVALTLYVGDERLSLEQGDLLAHERMLDLREGRLVRCWRHRLPSGRIVRVTTLRCASLDDREALLQRAWIVPENYDGRLRLVAMIDGRAGYRVPSVHQAVPPRSSTSLPGVLLLQAPRAESLLAMAQDTLLSEDGVPVDVAPCTRDEPACLVQEWEWQAEKGRTYVFDRLVSAFTSRQVIAPAPAVARHVQRLRASGIYQLVEAHRQRWSERWRASDVQIDGDVVAQRALRFAIYHLIISANPDDERVSIGARDLSGRSYRGHVLWDTEIYMLPFFTFTWPAAARAMLMYRYHGLDAARAKAAGMGYGGALYPWEVAASGHEATVRWDRGPEGEPIPLYTWLRSHHVSADVAYAVWQYWRATGDDDFLVRAGAEILLETARFWASRARLETDGRYHVREVIGPDEYHERVDDSAYTNAMARLNLELGRQAAQWLQQRNPQRWRELSRELALDGRELEQWEDVGERLAFDCDPGTGLIEQFAGYFGREDLDLSAYAGRLKNMQDLLGREHVARTQIIKQADVVLLCHLLWDRLDRLTALRNFDYYESRCEHASSLSPSAHALVAARLGRLELARQYFDQAATIDLQENLPAAEHGVHIANCGGLWQAVVFGAAGMQLLEDGLAFNPHLLPGWRALRFPVQWRGRMLRVAMDASGPTVAVSLEGEASMVVSLHGGPQVRVEPGVTCTTRWQGDAWEPWHVAAAPAGAN